ncbi:DUF3426 domain-containing protein [Arhodomonas sp. KWT]|uniref:DUF3426 domain-containing protein n=1 Tax=Arhodomonas sp. KWT TaxID=2679915 RepID=UPI0013D03F96|nr:DUF3426 domain-containing protein [Arhodomonas sp. KWT]
MPPAPRHARCPECGTLFRVTLAQSGAAGGRCRCGVCGAVFDVRTHTEDLPGDTPDLRAEPALGELGGTPVPDAPPPRERMAPAADWLEPGPGEEEPVHRRWPWWLAAVVLLLAIAGQLTWFNRQALLGNPLVRDWAVAACEVAGCTVPLPRRPAAVRVDERALRASPNGDRLRFTAQIANTAPTPIEWPQMRLRLTALNGQILAERGFEATDYLDRTPPGTGMPPGETVDVSVEIDAPQPPAQGFEVFFR